ncbi:cupin domain-containing protein [Novosphingobium sp. TH158]|uniref:cupin domain-containing protein n=1 Tax=Novosphingobium sp. TH158 TaxID=2067455 RepID=UPI000C7B0B64|nr:cupin domain-containing protein [Novosphingobium sp. TH158]PLK27012.1 hypothetical protein C0V78_09045 [Novosphingobium sp. TH158]
MPKIVLMRDAESEWEQVDGDWKAKYAKGDASLRFKRLMRHGMAGMPNVQRTEYMPHHHEPPHSHPEDEVIFVLSGTLFHGRDRLGFGDAIYVARDTTYSLRTEEEGASFVRVGFGDLSAPAA